MSGTGDYISREAVVKTTRETPFTMSMCLSVEECKGMNRARNILADIFEILPAADVRPVVHGTWVDETNKWSNGFRCSQCGHKIFCGTTNYCPNCGADMREES